MKVLRVSAYFDTVIVCVICNYSSDVLFISMQVDVSDWTGKIPRRHNIPVCTCITNTYVQHSTTLAAATVVHSFI